MKEPVTIINFLRWSRICSLAAALFIAAPLLAQSNMEADRELRFAFQMLHGNMERSAVPHLRNFIENYPGHSRIAEARFGLARALEKLSDSGAIAAYRSYIEHHPAGASAQDARLGLARSLYAAEQWSDARSAFNEFHTRYPASPDKAFALYYEGLALGKLGRHDRAFEVLAQASQAAAGELKGEAAFSAAAALYRAKRLAESAEALSAVAREYSGLRAGAKAEALLGDLFYYQGEFAEARRRYLFATKADLPNKDDILFWSAVSAVKGGDTIAGVNELIAMAEAYPDRPRAFEALRYAADVAALSARADLVQKAVERMGVLRELDPEERAEALYRQGIAHFEAKDFSKAQDLLLRLMELDAGWQAEANYLLGVIAQKGGRLAEAESFLLEAGRLSDDEELSNKIVLQRLEVYRSSGNIEAVNELVRGLAGQRTIAVCGVLVASAQLHEEAGNLSAALEDYRRVVRECPGTAEALSARYAMGIIEYTRGDYRSAEKSFSDFIDRARGRLSMEPFLDDAWYWVGFSRYQLDEPEGALKAFLEVAALPESDQRVPALLRAGDAAYALERYTEAIEYYDTILGEAAAGKVADASATHDARFNKAVSLRAVGRHQEAIELFRETYRLGGESYEAGLLIVAEILEDLEKYTEAAKSFEEAAGQVKGPGRREDALVRAARVFQRIGDERKAAGLFRQAVESGGSQVPDALYTLGRISLSLGDTDSAREYFRQATEQFASTYFGRRSAVEAALLHESPTVARRILEAVVKAVPEDQVAALARVKLGEIAWRAGDAKAAIELITAGLANLAEGDDLGEAKILLGRIHLDQNDLRSARRHLEYIWLSPDHAGKAYRARAGVDLARVHLAANRKKDAVNVLKEVADRYPEVVDAKAMLETLR